MPSRTTSFSTRPSTASEARSTLSAADVKVRTDTWHSLRIDFSGSRFRVSFNGQQLFEVEDSTFADAGKIGLWTKADSVTLFDEITYGDAK